MININNNLDKKISKIGGKKYEKKQTFTRIDIQK